MGPGSYQIGEGQKAIRKRVDVGVPKLKRLTVDQSMSEYMYVGDALVPSYFNNNSHHKKLNLIMHQKNVDYILAKKTPIIKKKVHLTAVRPADNTPPTIKNERSRDALDEHIRNSYLLNYESGAQSHSFRRKRTSSARPGHINIR